MKTLVLTFLSLLLLSGCASQPSLEETKILMGPDNQLLAEKLATDLNATSEVSDIVAILGKPARSFGGRNDWTISDQPPVRAQAYFGVMDDKLYKIKLIGLDPLWRLDLEY